jgi:putative transposase
LGNSGRTTRLLVGDRLAGSQYTSVRFAESLLLAGMIPSIGSVGDAFDNALAETAIGL